MFRFYFTFLISLWSVRLLEKFSYRSNHPEVFYKKGILKNFAKILGKHLCRSLFFNKVAGGADNIILKETPAQVFCCEFSENFKNTYFVEHLRTAAPIHKSQSEWGRFEKWLWFRLELWLRKYLLLHLWILIHSSTRL